MIKGNQICLKVVTLLITDPGDASNFIVAGALTNVAHGLPFAPTKAAILSILSECKDNSAFDNAAGFKLVSIDGTNIVVKADKTVAAHATVAGSRNVTIRIQVLLDRDIGGRNALV